MRRPAIFAGRCLGFRCDETGAGTLFGLFGITVCLMLAGVAVDFGNAWRQREVLRLSADVASHAGVSALARGNGIAAAMAAATTAVALNTPEGRYGRVMYDPFEDIHPFHYDVALNREVMSGPINAIAVQLERDGRVRNPVPTFLLRLIGQDDWNIQVKSVAAVVPTERCQSSEGVFARDTVTLNGGSMVGKGVCLHSQAAVALPASVSFAGGSGLSMPDMGNCRGMCSEGSSPGLGSAAASVNLIMPKPSDHIARLETGFADPKKTIAEETAFFAAHPLAKDLSALEELGVPVEDLKTGDVIALDAETFGRARSLPAGLVYKVTCGPDEGGVLQIGLSQDEADAALMAPEDMSSAEMNLADREDGVAATAGDPAAAETSDPAADSAGRFVLDGLVLLSNCAFHFTPTAEVRGALLISSRTGTDAVLTAEEGARAGDAGMSCKGARQAVIMAQGSMVAPASFVASNAAFVIAGSVAVGGTASGAPALHRGLAIHAGGKVGFTGAHAFDACGTGSDTLLPTLDVIKYVIPVDPLVTQ